ncbi:hypothetical protein A2U01_0087999, partial [Trifolium medium]|nr:hypothetical protein [Trifolium medium]
MGKREGVCVREGGRGHLGGGRLRESERVQKSEDEGGLG